MRIDLDHYMQYWNENFPDTVGREAALVHAGRGQGILSQDQMIDHQNKASEVYGSYELPIAQYHTMALLAQHVFTKKRYSVVSLGSGPASYEIYLLAAGLIDSCVLVDISPAMQNRARELAKKYGVDHQIYFFTDDTEHMGPIDGKAMQAEIVLCINSIHWSPEWRRWVKIAAAHTRKDGICFLSGTMGHPMSMIDVPTFTGVASRKLEGISAGWVIPPQMMGDKVYAIQRYFFVGKKR